MASTLKYKYTCTRNLTHWSRENKRNSNARNGPHLLISNHLKTNKLNPKSMLTLLTLIGIVLTLVLIAAKVKPLRKLLPQTTQDLLDNKAVYFGALAVGLLLTFSDGLFFVAKPGTAYALQYVWGGDQAVTSQGLKLQWFGRTIPMSFEIAIQDTLGEVDAQDEIYYRAGQRWEFSDAIKADIAVSLVVGINYQDEDQFLATADKNRSENKLVHARIIPIYDQILKNTCKLQTAQEYIVGASTQFDFYLRDQLQHGMYLTEETEYVDDEDVVIGDSTAAANRKVTMKGNSQKRNKKYKIRRDRKTGEPLRDEGNSLSRYGLTVLQAAVTKVDWEDNFDHRLDDQKKQVAETQLKKAEAEKEYYSKLAAIEKGEREKAEEQKKLEKEQITYTIAAETRAKTAEWKTVEEKNLLTAARTTAERINVEANAKANQNRLMVSAGLTPQEKAYWRYRSDSVEWAFKSQIKLPGTVFMGEQGKSGDGILTQLIGAQIVRDMNKP